MATQQKFNYRSISGCIQAIKSQLHIELDNAGKIEGISFEFPDSLEGQVITPSTLDLFNTDKTHFLGKRSYAEIKAIAKNIQHAVNFEVFYSESGWHGGRGWRKVSCCWDFNVMVVKYSEEELDRRFNEFMTAN